PTSSLNRTKDAPPITGDWAAKLRAVGAALDGHPGSVRDSCILEIDDWFVVQAYERKRQGAEWKQVSLEIRTGDIIKDATANPARGHHEALCGIRRFGLPGRASRGRRVA